MAVHNAIIVSFTCRGRAACTRAELIWLIEHWAGFRLTIFGDPDELRHLGKESSVALCNHRSDIDWLIGWLIADKYNVLGVRLRCAAGDNAEMFPDDALLLRPSGGGG